MFKIKICVVFGGNARRVENKNIVLNACKEHFGTDRFADDEFIFSGKSKRAHKGMALHYAQLINELASAALGFAVNPAMVVKI